MRFGSLAFRVGISHPQWGSPPRGGRGARGRPGRCSDSIDGNGRRAARESSAAREYPWVVSLFAVVLLIAAATLVVAAEWTRIQQRVGVDARKSRDRARRKRSLRVVRPEPESDPDDFQRAVERDLAALPTTDDRDARNGKNR